MTKNLKSRELAFLSLPQIFRELDGETKQAIKEERIVLDEEPLYVNKKIATSGEIELLSANLNESVGITNIDKRTLPQFVYFIVSGIKFGYNKTLTATAATAEEVVYDSLIASVPAVMQHANVIVKQNDTPILTLPIKTFLQQAALQRVDGDAGYELKNLKLIKPKVPIQISIKFPEGQDAAVATYDTFVSVLFNGARTRLKGAR